MTRAYHPEASALWLRAKAREITPAEYQQHFPAPVFLTPDERASVPPIFFGRWVTDGDGVWVAQNPRFEYREASGRIRVLLDGKRVGTIDRERGTLRHGEGGYFYETTGSRKHRGEVFLTIEAVKQSIEGDE